jgi:hypothetical protein
MPIRVSCHSSETLNINVLFYCTTSTEALWLLTMSTQVFSFFTVCTQTLWLFAVSTEALWLFIFFTESLDSVQPPTQLWPSALPPQTSHRSLTVTVHVCLSSGDVKESVELSLHKHAEAPDGLWHSHCGQQSTKLTDRFITTFIYQLNRLFS